MGHEPGGHDLLPSSPPDLAPLAALAGRQFETTNVLIQAILQLLTEQLGLRTSFLTRIRVEDNHHEILVVHNQPGGCGLAAGRTTVLQDAHWFRWVVLRLVHCVPVSSKEGERDAV